MVTEELFKQYVNDALSALRKAKDIELKLECLYMFQNGGTWIIGLFDATAWDFFEHEPLAAEMNSQLTDEQKRHHATFKIHFDKNIISASPCEYLAKFETHLPFISLVINSGKLLRRSSGSHYIDLSFTDTQQEWQNLTTFNAKIAVRLAKAIYKSYKLWRKEVKFLKYELKNV